MTATKNNSIFKKLGALAMAMCLTCALAVSASAAAADDNYPLNTVGDGTEAAPYLTVDAAVPHTLDFFETDGFGVVVDDNNQATITMPLKNPANITVTVGGNSFTQSGEIVGATCTDSNYEVVLSDDHSTLTVICDADLTMDYVDADGATVYGSFAPVITFTVDLGTSSVQHRAVPATLHMMGSVVD